MKKNKRSLELLIAALTILILLVILTACSNPEERALMGESVGTVVYQKVLSGNDTSDTLLVVQDNILKIVFVSASGSIYRVDQINGYKLIKDVKY